MPFVSVFFHFIIDLGLFCGTTGHHGHLFLKLHVLAGVSFLFFVVPDVPLSRFLGG